MRTQSTTAMNIPKLLQITASVSSARHLLRNRTRLGEFLRQAAEMASAAASSAPGQFLDDLGTAIRLLRAVTKGEYRGVRSSSLALLIVALIYFVIPLDYMPDPIFVDDAAVLAWALGALTSEIGSFRQWEGKNSRTPLC